MKRKKKFQYKALGPVVIAIFLIFIMVNFKINEGYRGKSGFLMNPKCLAFKMGGHIIH